MNPVLRGLAAAGLATAMVEAGCGQPPEEASQRAAMLQEIRETYRMAGTGAPEAAVMEAMGRTRRHEFVPPELAAVAYDNRPLPIGSGQTISQPYIVALMTQLAGIRPGARVLEVGTGSGYQAAVLADMGATVHTIEIVPALAETARVRLARLGYRDVHVVTGDGYLGLPAHAPYDAILVTAGAGHVPPELVKQMKPGARMVIPVGDPLGYQELTVVEKAADGAVKTRRVIPVRFVPLTR
jgi:protein-L-isoaspartate(D-aspartate) O-methyltransferase